MLSASSGASKGEKNKTMCCLEATVVEVSDCLDFSCPSAGVIITIPPCVGCFKATVELHFDCPAPCQTCLCKAIQKVYDLPDLACVQTLSVYHMTTRCDKTCSGNIIIAGYNITIQYIDHKEIIKTVNMKDKVVFEHLPCNFSADNFTLLFKDISCNYNACDVLTVCFTAELCNCASC